MVHVWIATILSLKKKKKSFKPVLSLSTYCIRIKYLFKIFVCFIEDRVVTDRPCADFRVNTKFAKMVKFTANPSKLNVRGLL